jgi:hypothetical protein
MSQVLAEQRHFSADQAYLVCEYFAFTDNEKRFYLKLYEFERAANHQHRSWLQMELKEIQQGARRVSSRVQYEKELSNEDKGLFYSDWYYSALRMLCSIEPMSLTQLVERVKLPREILLGAVEELLRMQLLIDEGGKYRIGTLSTHVEANSPWVAIHHSNWRKKALENCKVPYENKVHYTSPMTLSKADVIRVQERLLEVIEEAGEIVDNSDPEEFMCLNIDWFKV